MTRPHPWRLALAGAVTRLLLPPYSARMLRGALYRVGGADVALGVEVGGGTLFAHTNVHVGRGSYVGPGCEFHASYEGAITVGERVAFGPNVVMLTASHDHGPHDRRAGQTFFAPVTIGDGCWIGANTTILPGVTIGAGSIVAAGSVVVGDVAEDVIVAGVPAKVVKEMPSPRPWPLPSQRQAPSSP